MGKLNFTINVILFSCIGNMPKLVILVTMVSEVELVLLFHSTLKDFNVYWN